MDFTQSIMVCLQLGDLEGRLKKIDADALERLIAANERAATRRTSPAENVFFEHVLARQKLLLFCVREWKSMMAAAPAEPATLSRRKDIFAGGGK